MFQTFFFSRTGPVSCLQDLMKYPLALEGRLNEKNFEWEIEKLEKISKQLQI